MIYYILAQTTHHLNIQYKVVSVELFVTMRLMKMGNYPLRISLPRMCRR